MVQNEHVTRLRPRLKGSRPWKETSVFFMKSDFTPGKSPAPRRRDSTVPGTVSGAWRRQRHVATILPLNTDSLAGSASAEVLECLEDPGPSPFPTAVPQRPGLLTCESVLGHTAGFY